MTASPVLQQVTPILEARFREAQVAGRVGRDIQFQIGSEPTGGGKRRYFCLGPGNQRLGEVEPTEATPTICD